VISIALPDGFHTIFGAAFPALLRSRSKLFFWTILELMRGDKCGVDEGIASQGKNYLL
jgi:hypothetical protein